MTKFGLGAAVLGRPEYINIKEKNLPDRSEQAFLNNALEIFDVAYAAGIRYFDTAPSYGKGEQFLTTWQSQRNHTDTELATKWGYTYVANWELGFVGNHEVKEHSIEKLIAQWETSKHMIPALKVYQIHSATLESGVLDNETILLKLAEIKTKTGLLIGLTTSGAQQATVLEKAATIKINNQFLFDVFQVTYNVFEQSTFEILKNLIATDKKIVIKEGVANGRIFNNTPTPLQNLANKYQVGIDAIALRFVIDKLHPAVLLSGAFNKTQLEQNLKALDFTLNQEELQTLQNLKMEPNTYWGERKELRWN